MSWVELIWFDLTQNENKKNFNALTQNLTKKKASCGPLSYNSLRPSLFWGNLSLICRISMSSKGGSG